MSKKPTYLERVALCAMCVEGRTELSKQYDKALERLIKRGFVAEREEIILTAQGLLLRISREVTEQGRRWHQEASA